MFISRAPLRISFFGGSSDYQDFYSQHGSLLIGGSIDKYAYTGLRYRPRFLDTFHHISYSKQNIVDDINKIENPLIRETLRYFKIDKCVDLVSFNDVPSRTGLGGSSSFCVSLIHSIYKLKEIPVNVEDIVKSAIKIEREILKDSGGIQDQIWAGFGGLNSIEILPSGQFLVKPLPVTKEFIREFEKSICLIYTNEQRLGENIAMSHNNVDKTSILDIAKLGYKAFSDQNIKNIGDTVKYSWEEKKKISNLISTNSADSIIKDCLNMGCYGGKLLGSGGCGFVCVVGNPLTINKVKKKYKESILNFSFVTTGVTQCM